MTFEEFFWKRDITDVGAGEKRVPNIHKTTTRCGFYFIVFLISQQRYKYIL